MSAPHTTRAGTYPKLEPRTAAVARLCNWLRQNGGRHWETFAGPSGDRMELWHFGDGRHRRNLFIQQYRDDNGFDVYGPVVTSNLTLDVYTALAAMVEDATPPPDLTAPQEAPR
jgi:hypothetical protein